METADWPLRSGGASSAANSTESLSGSTVLIVDLDGTVMKSDLLVETALQFLKAHPLSFPLLGLWLAGGKANLKQKLAERVDIDAPNLPYHAAFLDYLRAEKAKGRAIWLATASHRKFAQQVSDHLGLFDKVIATDQGHNLSGARKLEALLLELGSRPFDYAGNARIDLKIWPRARRAIVVNARPATEAAAQAFAVERVFPREGGGFRAYLRALRIYQWVKNILVFVPLLLSHQIADLQLLASCIVAFLAFGMTASCAYTLNDLLDLEADRRHPRKRKRPYASGELSPLTGILLAPALFGGAALLSSFLPPQFSWVLVAYFAGTLAYSFKFKRHAMLDVMALAGLYTLRIIAGIAATSSDWSFWLLAFSVFMFLSLALIKRYAELKVMQRDGKHDVAGRSYLIEDFSILSSAGIASGYLAALVLALYLNSPEVLVHYQTPQAIWGVCFLLLYWISRMWMVTHRGDMHDDPIVYSLTDRTSLLIGVAAVAIVVIASI